MANPQKISDDGTVWNLHRGGEKFPFVYESASGVPIDISADTLTFRVHGGLTVQFTANAGLPTGKMLILTPEHLASIPTRGADFRIKNETTGDVYMAGRCFVWGVA